MIFANKQLSTACFLKDKIATSAILKDNFAYIIIHVGKFYYELDTYSYSCTLWLVLNHITT